MGVWHSKLTAVRGLLALLLGALVQSPSNAQQAPAAADPPPYQLCTTPQLTGGWWGCRSCLADSGVSFYADNTSFLFGNAAGGVQQTLVYGGHADYITNLDGGKLWGLEGFSVKIKAEHRFGESITGDVGSFLSPTISTDLPKFGSDRLYLTNVLLTQMINESFGVFAGKLDTLDGEANAFASGRGKTQFSNLAFVFNPVLAETVPYATLGTGFFLLRDKQPFLNFSVLNSTDTTGTAGFNQLFSKGVLISSNVRFPTNFFGQRGHQVFGGTWNSGEFNSLREAYLDYPNVVIPTTRGSWSLYWNFDQNLVTDPDDPTKGWGLFGRAGIADINTNPISWFLSAGVGGNSPIASRPADTFGVGWYYVGSSSQISPILTALLGPIGNGQGIECYYNYQFTPAVRITPDIQVITPAQSSINTSLVLGLRAQLIF